MNHSEIRDVLIDKGVNPSKKLGQNFLTDANVARWIVDQLLPTTDDVVIEIGPGTGALTEHLVGRVKHVILVEFDARLAEYQSQKYEDRDDVEVFHCDGARFDTRQLLKYGPVKFIGNLPYSAGGAIMRNLMKKPTNISRAVLMLQKEFIDRIIAVPRTKAFGVLSLRMQSEWHSEPVKTVPPEAFHPRPLIDSTVMVCKPLEKNHFPTYDLRLYDELIRRGFAQRRKQVRKQMPDHRPWEEIAEIMGIPETTRAEELSVEQWIEITRHYDDHPLKDLPQSPDELFDVVDDSDAVLRQETRAIVHAKNLKHRAVHVLVFNKHREVFIQKRSLLKDTFPGAWDSSAAGHLNAGESYDDCVLRELNEELGIEVELEDVQQITVLPPSEKTGWEFIGLYITRHDGALRYPCSEVETGIWMTMDELELWVHKRPEDFASGFIECWQAFQQKMNG